MSWNLSVNLQYIQPLPRLRLLSGESGESFEATTQPQMSWNLSVNLQYIQPLPRLRLLCSLLLLCADCERCENTLQHLWERSGGDTSLNDTYGNWSYSTTSFPFWKKGVFAEDCDFITTVETCLLVIVFCYFRDLVQPRTKGNKDQKNNKKPQTLVKSLQCSCSPSVMCRIRVSPAVQMWIQKSVFVLSTTRDKSPVRERKLT